MNRSAARYFVFLGCLLAAVYASFLLWRKSEREAHARPERTEVGQMKEPVLVDFVLTDAAGQPFDSQNLKGKVWVGSFFFTNCPAVCWRLNQTLAAMQDTNLNSPTRYVSITCDPENDTPEALTKYAEHFHADPARWTFLTGDMKLIKRIGNDMFQVGVETATHSDRAFVVDREGKVRARLRLTEPDQLEKLKQILAVVEREAAEHDAKEPVSATAEGQ